jgi:hypothetical protein
MRILIVTTDYADFQRSFYGANPALEAAPFDQQVLAREAEPFGIAASHAHYLRRLGHDVGLVISNCEPMQRAWAAENSVNFGAEGQRRVVLRGGFFPWFSRDPEPAWRSAILLEQLRRFKPDVLLNESVVAIRPSLVARMRPYARRVVGLHGAILPDVLDLSGYDLLISSHRGIADQMARSGVRVEMVRHAFDARVLQFVGAEPPAITASFIGNLGTAWNARSRWLELLCSRHPVHVYGPPRMLETTPMTSAIRRSYMGEAWGTAMFRTLRASRVSLNIHTDMAGMYASNMRMFEATGVGSLLLTDQKPNIDLLFEPGVEVLTFNSDDECSDLLGRCLVDEPWRAGIAAAGHLRTLTKHSMEQRIRDLAELLEGCLTSSAKA